MHTEPEIIDTIVVGAGQAGIATSEHLTRLGVPHVVLEKDRIVERWRTRRWDSLVVNGPAWHDRFPNLEFAGESPDGFPGKERVVAYFEEYAKRFAAPVRTGVTVTSAERLAGTTGLLVKTSQGDLHAQRIVVATGAFQRPVIPAIAPQDDSLVQIHSADYRNPTQLPEGGVLVVGAGSSGVQIADELRRAGRKVFLSVGPHERPPRAYRGRDFCWWLGVLGEWDAQTPPPAKRHITIAVSGAFGGHTVDFRRLGHDGIVLLGSTVAFEGGVARFDQDLAANIRQGDESYFDMLRAADAYVDKYGVDLAPEPQAWDLLPDPDCVREPWQTLDLAAEGIKSIVWATGYAPDYGWMKFSIFDPDSGRPQHARGVSAEPGVYFVGLPFLANRRSAFIWGVWHDAKLIADHIDTQRKYEHYAPDASVVPARDGTALA